MAAKRGFIHSNECWYFNTTPRDFAAEVLFGLYSEEGGTKGEMAVRWHTLYGQDVAHLEVYDESWALLVRSFPDVLNALADKKGIQPKEFCALLTELGFKDMTARKNPYRP